MQTDSQAPVLIVKRIKEDVNSPCAICYTVIRYGTIIEKKNKYNKSTQKQTSIR